MKEIIKNTFKNHSWFIVGLLVCFTIIDLIMKKGFSISDFLIRIITITILYFITEVIAYNSKKK